MKGVRSPVLGVLVVELDRLAFRHPKGRTGNARLQVVGLPGPHLLEGHRTAVRRLGDEFVSGGHGAQGRFVTLFVEVDDLRRRRIIVVGQRPVVAVGGRFVVVGETAGEGGERTRTDGGEDRSTADGRRWSA